LHKIKAAQTKGLSHTKPRVWAFRTEFEHFILRFNKMSLLCGYHWKRGLGVKGGAKTGW
jgi:hypothetical protein